MEAQSAQPPSGLASAAYPRWVMLERGCKRMVDDSSGPCMGDPKTLVSARTSSGHLIHVSLRLAEPPTASCVYLQTLDDGIAVDCQGSAVLAAHGDSVLIVVRIDEGRERYDVAADHFVYCAGAAAADPPTAAVAVASPARGSRSTRTRELILFRSGEWSVKHPETSNDQRGVGDTARSLTDTVIPVGDRRLCWVDLSAGVLLCDMLEESPRLQYVPLPVVEQHRWVPRSNRSVCVTAGGGALKFIDVSPSCCCGGAGASTCRRSLHAFTITTWTMRVDGGGTEEMEWVKDAVVDTTELWALDAYKGLQRVPLDLPVVSIYEPDVICFFLHEPRWDDSYCRGRTLGLLMADMRRKTIQSISRAQDMLPEDMPIDTLVPSIVSDYFNSCSSVDIEKPEVVVGDDDDEQLGDDEASNPTPRALCASIRDLGGTSRDS
ncbi:hypothetical protein BS78_K012700 [Paspalum vaginatum]|uniref:DUF1618 domain-containing protein n=1 Tax=Paspalum vaginatum TaxID=158149 RepID=A0A9W8CG52_9POAL|nr:hypothetical protein BS78_K012700 [Paspalum vaginatum]